MNEKAKRRNSKPRKQLVQASPIGSTRISLPMRDRLVHPDAAPLHQIPKDNNVEVALSKVENLLGKGHYGAALQEANTLKIGNSPLAGHYALIRQEKISRAHLGIADRYFIRGDTDNARKFYELSIQMETANPTIKGLAEMAGRVFDNLVIKRKEIIKGLRESIKKDSYEQWCGQKKDLGDLTILDVAELRARVVPDFHLESVFGERLPFAPQPGYIEPLPLESDFVSFPSAVPGSVFKAATDEAINVDLGTADRIRASVAMPLIGNVMIAKVRLFALDAGLNLAGQASGTVPLFRYEYLRDKVKQSIAHIQQIESRMLPIQFQLDDFAEVVDAIRRPLAEQKAELEAIKQRIRELTDALAALTRAEKAVAKVVAQLQQAEEECECDWWCWTQGITLVILGTALGAAAGFMVGVDPVLFTPGVFFFYYGFETVQAGIEQITCQNVNEITGGYQTALTGLGHAIGDVEAELHHALIVRDVLIANINALSDELSEVYQSNAARVLDAKTLDLIQSQYNSIRQSLLTRSQAVAKMAEDAFNFGRDADVHLIKEAYFDKDRKDYTAAESLLRDLDGLDYINLTGRAQKAMQLCHVVSLRKHYPMSFVAMKMAGGARFTTELKEFDRWFPGTYMQQIKEVRVEVLVDDKVVPARGYISNDGVSFVRFQDPGNKRKVDEVHVFAEPDPDLAKLCYKRFQRRRHVDTMAFPDFSSYLYEDRMRKLQDRERNFFENVGLKSTWLIELLPNQPFDLSQLTDIRIYFQYEAFFDENLKHVLEQKRYTGRREMMAISVKKLLQDEGKAADFSETVTIKVRRELFEAPVIDKKIVNVGFMIKPKGTTPLEGIAELEVSYEGAVPIRVATNNLGTVATAGDHPAGTGLAELEAMAHGKNVDGTWTVKIVGLPGGLGADAVDDIFLLLNYEYSLIAPVR